MKYTTLYFDLDNTLLDFSAAEARAISGLLQIYEISPDPEYISLYSSINRTFWERFEKGEIGRDEIFEGRFREFTKKLGVRADTKRMSADYFLLLSKGHDIIKGAKVVLEYVKDNGYTVCITTNGVSFTQHKRTKDSGLEKYFDFVFISEETGHQKPEKAYFDYVIENSPEKDRSKILIVGDSVSSDILGGINSGIDTCWLNPESKKPEYRPTYEIRNISELLSII